MQPCLVQALTENYQELELLMWKAINLNIESKVQYGEIYIRVRSNYLHVDRGLLTWIITWKDVYGVYIKPSTIK